MNGLAKTYSDRMNFEIKNYRDGDSPERIKRYGFERHGMVIAGAGDEVIWSEDGHMQTERIVERAIKKALGD